MTNTLTVDQLQELLKIQKEFDDRIPTLNLEDSKIAYVVEFLSGSTHWRRLKIGRRNQVNR